MRELTIGIKLTRDQRLDRFVAQGRAPAAPALAGAEVHPPQAHQGATEPRCRAGLSACAVGGPCCSCTSTTSSLTSPREDNVFLTLVQPKLHILYEDENILLLDKRRAWWCTPTRREGQHPLNHLQAYLYQKREWNPRWENAFTPALCNRIDRNTAASSSRRRTRRRCAILNGQDPGPGAVQDATCAAASAAPDAAAGAHRLLPAQGRGENGHRAPSTTGRCLDGRKAAVTLGIETLEPARAGLRLVEVGAAHGADAPDPGVLRRRGPPPAGRRQVRQSASVNRRYGETQQALYSYRLRFDFPTDAGILNYLRGREFIADEVPSGGNTSAEHAGEYIFNLYIKAMSKTSRRSSPQTRQMGIKRA